MASRRSKRLNPESISHEGGKYGARPPGPALGLLCSCFVPPCWSSRRAPSWCCARNARPCAQPPAGAPATGAAAGFNVLLITLDTVRAGPSWLYGYATARTPNLDALARTGLLFAQAIAPAPLTMPSHARF